MTTLGLKRSGCSTEMDVVWTLEVVETKLIFKLVGQDS
jgi:hypothetical protein